MPSKITHQEYIKSIEDSNFICLGKYQGIDTGIKHRCKTCGDIRDKNPHDVKRGRGCIACIERGQTTTHQEYIKSIEDSNFICLGEYINVRTKISHKCKVCGDIKDKLPNSVKGGKGCKVCSNKKSAYKIYKNISTLFYIVDIVGHGVKIGITLKDVKSRYSCKNDRCLDIRELSSIRFKDGWDAYILEQHILDETKNHQIFYSNETGPLHKGNTEIREYCLKDLLLNVFGELSKV